MSQLNNPYASFSTVAAQAPAVERADFIKRTYIHLAAAVYAFAALEFAIFKLLPVEEFVQKMFSVQYSWLIVLAAFMGVSWLANSWAQSATSLPKQYAGLFLYVLAEAVIFIPILFVASTMGPSIIQTAAIITLIMFAGLTAAVFFTGTDFSFMRTGLTLAGFAALGLIACSILFGFQLGNLFTVAMIVFASAYILYDTSNVMHHYRTDQHVAAALALFASVALLFWYILRLVMASRD